MVKDYIISCESTTDIGFEYFKKRNIPIIFYHYVIDDEVFEDNMGRNKKDLTDFYKKLSKGNIPKTSQINEYSYYEYFKNLSKNNKKILHFAFGSCMTPSVNNAVIASAKINEEIGEDLITVIDSTCSSSGYGLFMMLVYEFADSEKTIDEVKNYSLSIRKNIHHQFFSTDMTYFKRSGRVSGVSATVATILGICPIMHLDNSGKIIAYDKVRGKKNATKVTVDEMVAHAVNGTNYCGKCIINHSNCYDDALELKKEIESTFPNLKTKIEICDIGNIVASHCGPGTVAVYFLGDERK